MSDYLESIAPEIAALISSNGFKITEAKKLPNEFGNTSIVLVSSEFKLRVYTDRGQSFVDVARDGQEWHKLEYILEFLDSSCSQEWLGTPPDIGKLFTSLQRNMKAVAELLASDLMNSDFSMFEKKRAMALIAKIFSSS